MSRYTLLMNSKIFALGCAFCLLAISQATKAQSVTVDATIDSLQILIGEQAKIKLEVSYDAKQKVRFPQFNDTIISGVEIVDVAKADTQYLNNRQRLLVTQEYTVTAFDSALYYLPPFEVMVDNKVYKSKALALKVYSMPVDTLHADQIFGQKAIMNSPFAWEDWKDIVLYSFLMIPLFALIIFFIIRLNDNKPIIRKMKVEPKLPPHQLAMKEIERIKAEKEWQKGNPKEYYTELTDTIRVYIKDRFGFNALEMISSEIISKLLETNDKESIEDLKLLFQTADLVKFAKHNPLINENDMNLVNAIEFINQTKVEDVINKKPEPIEITVEEKRSKRAKILLFTGIVVLSASVIYLLLYVGSEIYNLCF
ncbi:MAG: BatD family protein [Bacteroides sp.]